MLALVWQGPRTDYGTRQPALALLVTFRTSIPIRTGEISGGTGQPTIVLAHQRLVFDFPREFDVSYRCRELGATVHQDRIFLDKDLSETQLSGVD